jgi:hypothetical protein
MLKLSTRWRRDASIFHPMAAGCIKFALNGREMLKSSTGWWRDASNLSLMAA